MDNQLLQKEIFSKIGLIVRLTDQINKELSKRLITKSELLKVELTVDLQEKCAHYLTEPFERTQYQCKVCGKKFDDGRKLGGHVSRAHKPQTNQVAKAGKKIKKAKVKYEDLEES